jgi:hypothetical protein
MVPNTPSSGANNPCIVASIGAEAMVSVGDVSDEVDVTLVESDLGVDEEGNNLPVSTLDTQIMEVILGQIVVPAMQRKRAAVDAELTSALEELSISSHDSNNNSSSSSSSSSSTPTAATVSGVAQDPMLLTLDGDHPQIEAVFNDLLPLAISQNIEFLKFPGGGSLQFQPNDLMRSHAIIKQYVKSKQYIDKKNFEPPIWMPKLRAILAPHRIDKASIDCFEGFFIQLQTILSKAFTVSTIMSGWATSGIFPLDTTVILEKCVRFEKLDEEQRTRCLEAVPVLVERAKWSGICLDVDIASLVGDIAFTDIKNMHERVINQQRSLWLNKEGVLEYRRALRLEREKREQITREKQALAQQRAADKKRLQEEQIAQHEPIVDRARVTTCSNDQCNEAHTLRRVNLSVDDMWRGCGYCDFFYCHRSLCFSKLLKHQPVCKLRRQLRV